MTMDNNINCYKTFRIFSSVCTFAVNKATWCKQILDNTK